MNISFQGPTLLLDVFQCLCRNCTSATSEYESGGGIVVAPNGGAMYSNPSNFCHLGCVNGSAAWVAGHFHLCETRRSGIVKECHFENETSGNCHGGGIWIRDSSSSSPYLTFSFIDFVNCTSLGTNEGYEGGGGMELETNSFLSLSNSPFFNGISIPCSGGGITFGSHSLFISQHISLRYCFFSNSPSKTPNADHSIYVGSDWKCYVKEEMITTCFSTKARGDSSVYSEGEGEESDWLPISFSSLYLSSSDEIDLVICGNSVENPCKTMENIKIFLSHFSPPKLLLIVLVSPFMFERVEEAGGRWCISSDEINKVELIVTEEVEGEGEEWRKISLSPEFIRIIFSFPSLLFSFS
jgi:hypothetical protein